MKNIKSKPRNKNVVKSEPVIEGLSWKLYHLSEERKEQLLKAWSTWAANEDNLQVTAFYRQENITSRLWNELALKDERFRVLNEDRRTWLGERREKAMWFFKMAIVPCLKTQRFYHEDFERAYQDEVALKKEIASAETNVRFLPVLPSVVDTGIVKQPELIDETI